MKRLSFEDMLIILIILIIIIIICIMGYLNIGTKMSIANHYGLDGWDYWWYVIGNHGG